MHNAVMKVCLKLQTGDLFQKLLKLCNIFLMIFLRFLTFGRIYFILMEEA